MEEYDVTKYPEGVERAMEFLAFLPDDKAVRQQFMDAILNLLVTLG